MPNAGRSPISRLFAGIVCTDAAGMGVKICDCCARRKCLAETGDTTMLPANRIDHLTAEMHELFAESLSQVVMEA